MKMAHLLLFTILLTSQDVSSGKIKSSPELSVDYEKCIPHSPRVNCSFLPWEFIECESPEDIKGNGTELEDNGRQCSKFGGWRYEDVQHISVECHALDGIECCGSRSFYRGGVPCVKYSGHYFSTTLIYSLLLGFLGLDRFCLGLTGTAVGKLLTLGGLGVWWVVDIVLLITGSLTPQDNSNWNINV